MTAAAAAALSQSHRDGNLLCGSVAQLCPAAPLEPRRATQRRVTRGPSSPLAAANDQNSENMIELGLWSARIKAGGDRHEAELQVRGSKKYIYLQAAKKRPATSHARHHHPPTGG